MKEKQFSANWFDRHEPTFRKHLKKLTLATAPLNFLEIGSFEGKSACFLMDNFLLDPDDHLFCADTFGGSPEHDPMRVDYSNVFETFMANVKEYGNKVTVLKGKSQEMIRELPIGYFDFIYIDGSHVASDVLEDAVISWRLLKKGGIMAFDDYFWSFWSDRYGDNPNQKPDDHDSFLKEPKMAINAFIDIFRNQYTALELRDQVWIRKDV